MRPSRSAEQPQAAAPTATWTPPDVRVGRERDGGRRIHVRNARWDLNEFHKVRREVLAGWPTGREIDLEEAVAYHHSLAAYKNYARKVAWAKQHGITLVQPRGGVATIEEHLRLLQTLQDEGGADLLPLTTDSYTRNERWQDAERGLEASLNGAESALNGVPVVNHGHAGVRRLVEALDHPIIALTGTARPRLTAEVVLAAGVSAYLGSPIAYTMSYAKEISLQQGIEHYQYLDRLCSLYIERGVPLHREQPGFLTGTLLPPGISVAVSCLDMLLSLEQGIRHYSPGIEQNLCLVQDVAALLALEEVLRTYADRFGYTDVIIPTVSDQWMGGFPPDHPRAMAVIAMGATIPHFGRATQVVTKSPQEAGGIPTHEANATGARLTKTILTMLEGVPFPDSEQLRLDKQMIAAEACSIVDRALELGDGDAAVGTLRAVWSGTLDIPWSPNQENANKVFPVRDARGDVRYFSTGDLPFPPEVLEYNRERLAERSAREGREQSLQWVMEDVSAVARGFLLGTGPRWEDEWRSPRQAPSSP